MRCDVAGPSHLPAMSEAVLPLRPQVSKHGNPTGRIAVVSHPYRAHNDTMPLPFNKTLDLTLLKLVKENPIIYNSKHPKYLDFDTREVVWQKIGDILNRPAQVAKQRWINIRDMMRRKIRDRLRNPNHRSYNYKYEDEMSFMLPYFKETNNSNDEYSDFFEDSACDVELPSNVFEPEQFTRQDVKPNLTYKKHDEYNEPTEFQQLNPTDPIDVFLITIGSTLRKFSPYYLNQAKSKIFQVVQDYELQQIVDKDQPSSSVQVLSTDNVR